MIILTTILIFHKNSIIIITTINNHKSNMKQHTAEFDVIRGDNVTTDQQFTIKASARAFEILSSGLYSNKILAIVRELSCNAYDSHVSSGKQNVPIEVKLPSAIDSTFYVRDYGTGLSHEQVTSLYTTYFDSTKTDSNDFIGALGLGSKSPFSYTNSFIVESRFNGEYRIYSCFKNELNLPSINLLSTADTTEENGLTISLTVQQKDFEAFRTAAKTAFMYFNPVPVIINQSDFEPYYVKHTLSGSNWKMREAEYSAFYRGPRVIQGFISYPIDYDRIGDSVLSKKAQALVSTNLDLYVNIGDVDIAASREALSYDQFTIDKLINLTEQVADEIYGSIQNQFDLCESSWQVAQLIHKLKTDQGTAFCSLFTALCQVSNFEWNNQPITPYIHIPLNIFNHFSVIQYCIVGNKLRLKRTVDKWNSDFLVEKDHVFILDPYHRSRTVYTKFIYDHNHTHRCENTVAVVIRPIIKNIVDDVVLTELLSCFDTPEYQTAPQIQPKQKVVGVKRVRVKEHTLVWSGFLMKRGYHGSTVNRKFSRQCWTDELIDIDTGGFYVPIHQNVINYGSNTCYQFDNILENAKVLKIIPPDTKIVGFNKKEMVKISTNPDWKNLFDVINQHIDKNKVQYTNLLSHNDIWIVQTDLIILSIKYWKIIKNKDNEFGRFVDGIVLSKSDVGNTSISNIKSLIRLIGNKGIETSVSKKQKQLVDTWEHLTTVKYPLLNLIGLNRSDTAYHISKMNSVFEYVSMIDEKERLKEEDEEEDLIPF